jgi:hypothetical protein
MGGTYGALQRDGRRWHDIHTKLDGDRFKHSSNITVRYRSKDRVCNVGITDGRIYDLRERDGFRWYDTHTEIHNNHFENC